MAAREIQRWVDDATGVDACLREALRDAAHDAPNAAQLDKLIAGVDGALRAGATPSAPGPKLIVLGCAGMLLVSAGAWLAHRHYADAPQPPAAIQSVQRTTPAPEPPPSAAASAAALVSAPLAAEPPPSAAAARTPARRARPTPNLAPSPGPQADPAQEVRLLRDAKRALMPAPARARELLLEHQRAYANGAFVEEREALLIELSLREGEAQQARARTAAFRKRFPGSAYQRRIDDLLEER